MTLLSLTRGDITDYFFLFADSPFLPDFPAADFRVEALLIETAIYNFNFSTVHTASFHKDILYRLCNRAGTIEFFRKIYFLFSFFQAVVISSVCIKTI